MSNPSETETTQKKAKLSKKEYLEIALGNLADQAKSRLHLTSLIESMPVTSGSFYHHFSGKREFILAMINFWDQAQNEAVFDRLNELAESQTAQERLWSLMREVAHNKLNEYDNVVRSMAIGDDEIAERLAAVDRKRLELLEGLFSEMGFTGSELSTRARAFVVVIRQVSSLEAENEAGEGSEDLLRNLHAFFVRP